MEEKNNTKDQKKRLMIPFVIALAGSLVLIITLFLPFASAKDDYKEYLRKYSDDMFSEEIEMTNKEAINLSLFEYGRIYAKTAEMGIQKAMSITCLVAISIFAVLVILTTLFSLLKKPIVTIIFDLFSFGAFRLIMWDFNDRGVIPSRNYGWGIARYFCYIGAAVALVGAIYLLVTKLKIKKERKLIQNSAAE